MRIACEKRKKKDQEGGSLTLPSTLQMWTRFKGTQAIHLSKSEPPQQNHATLLQAFISLVS